MGKEREFCTSMNRVNVRRRVGRADPCPPLQAAEYSLSQKSKIFASSLKEGAWIASANGAWQSLLVPPLQGAAERSEAGGCFRDQSSAVIGTTPRLASQVTPPEEGGRDFRCRP